MISKSSGSSYSEDQQGKLWTLDLLSKKRNSKRFDQESFHTRESPRIFISSLPRISFRLYLLVLIVNFMSNQFNMHVSAAKSNEDSEDALPNTYTILIEGESEVWKIPKGILPDVISELRAEMVDGSYLPDWIDFNSETKEFLIHARQNNSENIVMTLKGLSRQGEEFNKTISLITRNVNKIIPRISPEFEFLAGENVTATPLKDDRFLVTYVVPDESKEQYEIYGRVYDTSGESVMEEFYIGLTDSQGENSNEKYYSIVRLEGGNVIISWLEVNDDLFEIYYSIIYQNGEVISDSKLLTAEHSLEGYRRFYSVPIFGGGALFVWPCEHKLIAKVLSSKGKTSRQEFVLENSDTQEFFIKPIDFKMHLLAWRCTNESVWYGRIINTNEFKEDQGITFAITTNETIVDNFNAEILNGDMILFTWTQPQEGNDFCHFAIYQIRSRVLSPETKVQLTNSDGPAHFGFLGEYEFGIFWRAKLDNNQYELLGQILRVSFFHGKNDEITGVKLITVHETFSLSGCQNDIIDVRVNRFTSESLIVSWIYVSDDEEQGTSRIATFGIYDRKNPILAAPRVVNPIAAEQMVVDLLSNSQMIVLSQKGNSKSMRMRASVYKRELLVNMPPELYHPIPNYIAPLAQIISVFIPNDTFINYDNKKDPLRVSCFSSEVGLSFNPVTFELSVFAKEKGTYNITVFAEDTFKANVTTYFLLTVYSETNLVQLVMLAFVTVGALVVGIYGTQWLYRNWHQLIPKKGSALKFAPLEEEVKSTISNSGQAHKFDVELVEGERTTEETIQFERKPHTVDDLIGVNKSVDLQFKVNLQSMIFTPIRVPKHFICPLTHELMVNPTKVISTLGGHQYIHTYERADVIEWYQKKKQDPLTRGELVRMDPDLQLKREIEQFILNIRPEQLKNQPNLKAEIENYVRRRGKESFIKKKRLTPILDTLHQVGAKI